MLQNIRKSSKINFYKFVQVKEPMQSKSLRGQMPEVAKTLNTNTLAINNLGATVNSIGAIAQDFKKIQIKRLELAIKNQKTFDANYTKTQKTKPFSGFSAAKLVKKPSWLEGLMKMLSGLIKAAIIIPALKWLSDPKNREKVSNMIEALSKLATFIFKVAEFGVVNTIEGLYDLMSDTTTPWEKIGGLVKGLTGLGTLLLGLRWLSNPTRIITDFGNVLIFLHNNLIRGRRGLLGRAGALGLLAGAAYGGFKLYQHLNEDGSGGNPDPNDKGKSQGGKVLGSFAQGGWITGPQSGYPVSLDGGRSTSFIGHGTEYVARKSDGGAFVVPFSTPGTKTQPHLTEKRLGEAKSQGFNVPGFDGGGKVPEMFMGGMMDTARNWWKNLTGGGGQPTKPTTSEPVKKKGQNEKPVIGAGLPAVIAGGKWALNKGFTVAEHPNFRKNNYRGNGSNTGVGFSKDGGERVGGHSNGSLHYKGLAIDITDWRPGAWKARTAQLAEQAYQLRDKMKLSQIIHDGWGQWFKGGGKSGPANVGHPEHLHLGFLEGISSGIKGGGGGSSSSRNIPAAAEGFGAILDLIGKRESDSFGGYNAVNQGGADGGHTALGYSGDYRKAPFNSSGKALTSMTVQEIMDKQFDDGSMSDSQWQAAGKLHAVGRYQFRGSTLKSLVDQGVVKPSDQFSPATQNKLAIALVKQTGGNVSRLKSTWIGLQKESDSAVSSAMAAGGSTTSIGQMVSATTGNKSSVMTPKAKMTLRELFGPSSSSEGMGISSGRGKTGVSPASQFQQKRQQKKVLQQTTERNNARRQVTERSQEMIREVMSAVAQQNGVNSQAIQAAQQAIASVAAQSGGNSSQLIPSGTAGNATGSIASTLQSTLNPLRGLIR